MQFHLNAYVLNHPLNSVGGSYSPIVVTSTLSGGNMIWFLSLFICLTLFIGLLTVLVPDLILPVFAHRWLRHFHYWRH